MDKQEFLKLKRQELCQKMRQAKETKKLDDLKRISSNSEKNINAVELDEVSHIETKQKQIQQPQPVVNYQPERQPINNKEYIKKRVGKEFNKEMSDLRNELNSVKQQLKEETDKKAMKQQIKEKLNKTNTIYKMQKVDEDIQQKNNITDKLVPVMLKNGCVAYRKVRESTFEN